MDAATALSELAASAVAVLASGFAQAKDKSIEEFAKSAGGAAWAAAAKLYRLVTQRFVGKPEAKSVEDLRAQPAERDAQDQFRLDLKRAMAGDPAFAEAVGAVLAEAKAAGGDVRFGTVIYKDVGHAYTIGKIEGGATFSVAAPAEPPRR